MSGAVVLGGAPLTGPKTQEYLLPPFEFQLNGTTAYTIGIALAEGQEILTDVNCTGVASLTFTLAGRVLRSEQLSGAGHFQFSAPFAATYRFVFQSEGSALVWFDIRSP